MGQTWLNRRIKGPNAEGDPVKKKKGGVKPYITHDRTDPRYQAHNDSLEVDNYNQKENRHVQSKGNPYPIKAIKRLEKHNNTTYGEWSPSNLIEGDHGRTGTFGGGNPYRTVAPKQKVILKGAPEKMKMRTPSSSAKEGNVQAPSWKDHKVNKNGKWITAGTYQKKYGGVNGLSKGAMFKQFPSLAEYDNDYETHKNKLMGKRKGITEDYRTRD